MHSNSKKAAWTLLELLLVLTLAAILAGLIFSAEQSWQNQLAQRTSLLLLQRSCDEARANALQQRLVTWLILQHSSSEKNFLAVLQENENGSISWITPWKELPKNMDLVFSPLLEKKFPKKLTAIPEAQLTGIAWNEAGSIIEPATISRLCLLTMSHKKIGQLLFLKNSGKVLLEK